MAMSENEAISKIQWRINTASEIAGKGVDGKAFEDLEMAIKALEEVQQYKEIGLTPKMVKEMIESEKLASHAAIIRGAELELYQAIGTIEEFKGLKEKSEPKKPNKCTMFSQSLFICPSCGRTQAIMYEQYHCKECGQKIDWSE